MHFLPRSPRKIMEMALFKKNRIKAQGYVFFFFFFFLCVCTIFLFGFVRFRGKIFGWESSEFLIVFCLALYVLCRSVSVWLCMSVYVCLSVGLSVCLSLSHCLLSILYISPFQPSFCLPFVYLLFRGVTRGRWGLEPPQSEAQPPPWASQMKWHFVQGSMESCHFEVRSAPQPPLTPPHFEKSGYAPAPFYCSEYLSVVTFFSLIKISVHK